MKSVNHLDQRDLPPCPECGASPIVEAELQEYGLGIGIRIGCPSRIKGHLEHAMNVDVLQDGRMTPDTIRAAMPQLIQWWNDQVAATEAEKAMRARGGRPRGRPGQRPQFGV